MLSRKKLAMLVAEFLGTGILTLVVLSVQRSQLGLAYFVAIAAGLAVIALTYTLGHVSGAHMNPALTFALWTARRIKTVPALLYIAVQLLGGWAAYALYKYFVSTDVQAVTQAFSGRIMVAEAIGAMVFALAWSAAAYNRFENARFAALAGLSFTIAIIVASAASLGLANPALAVGARAWEVFGENGWGNYLLGPILGAVIGTNLYGLLFANPEAPFSAFRRPSMARVTRVTTAADLDDEDDEEEVKVVKPRKVSSATTAKSKKATTKKVVSKKKR